MKRRAALDKVEARVAVVEVCCLAFELIHVESRVRTRVVARNFRQGAVVRSGCEVLRSAVIISCTFNRAAAPSRAARTVRTAPTRLENVILYTVHRATIVVNTITASLNVLAGNARGAVNDDAAPLDMCT